MKIKISDIISSLNVPSKEIKTRFKNKQIKLNGQDVDNIELDIEDFIMECGEFLCNFYDDKQIKSLNIWKNMCDCKPTELFGESSTIKLLDNLESFNCLSISKNEHYILMKE